MEGRETTLLLDRFLPRWVERLGLAVMQLLETAVRDQRRLLMVEARQVVPAERVGVVVVVRGPPQQTD